MNTRYIEEFSLESILLGVNVCCKDEGLNHRSEGILTLRLGSIRVTPQLNGQCDRVRDW